VWEKGGEMPGDEWWEAAVRASYQETWRMAAEEMFLGVRVEVSPGPAPPLTREAELRPCSFGDCGASSGALRAAYDFCPWRWPDETVEGDNVTRELLELVKAGDEAGFSALAGCVMPAGEVDDCWHGARARLGLLP